MARFLCWHFQEQAEGGLDPETAKHLDGLARGGKPGADRPRPQARHRVPARISGREAHRHCRSKRLCLARDDLCKPLDYRAGHPAERRGVNGFAGSGQCVASTKQQATPYSGGQVASGWRCTKPSRRRWGAKTMKPIVPKPQRCAIYARKSTEHKHPAEFNSLDAQREACEAYVKSQAHEAWRLVPDPCDDGGRWGASLARRALQNLLADVRGGKI